MTYEEAKLEIGLKLSSNSFYAHITEADGNVETLHLNQNLEAPNGDHWKAQIRLERWRNKKGLVDYLRKCADIIESA